MAERTVMAIKTDLQCPRCYRKIKRLLCRFYEIRDHVFDEKKNTVMITVYCCSPEKIRDKLISKGGKTIQSIEILQPPKPAPPAPAPALKPSPTDKPKDKSADKPKDKPDAPKSDPPKKPDPAPKPVDAGPPAQAPAPPKKEAAPPKEPDAKPAGPPVKATDQVPVNGFPQPVHQIGMCYTPYYEGYPETVYHPWYPGYPPPPPVMPAPPPYYESYYGRPCHCGRRECGSSCDYFSEENPSSCSIM